MAKKVIVVLLAYNAEHTLQPMPDSIPKDVVDSQNKYQLWEMLGVPVLGRSLAAYDPPPDLIVAKTSNHFEELSIDDQSYILSHYKAAESVGMYTIYHLSTGAKQ